MVKFAQSGVYDRIQLKKWVLHPQILVQRAPHLFSLFVFLEITQKPINFEVLLI